MKLIELNPRWVGLQGAPAAPVRMGLSFDCPHCREQRLVIHFKPPIDPQGLLAGTMAEGGAGGVKLWDRTGDSFNNLTLLPSIDASPAHWHGHILAGEVQTA